MATHPARSSSRTKRVTHQYLPLVERPRAHLARVFGEHSGGGDVPRALLGRTTDDEEGHHFEDEGEGEVLRVVTPEIGSAQSRVDGEDDDPRHGGDELADHHLQQKLGRQISAWVKNPGKEKWFGEGERRTLERKYRFAFSNLASSFIAARMDAFLVVVVVVLLSVMGVGSAHACTSELVKMTLGALDLRSSGCRRSVVSSGARTLT